MSYRVILADPPWAFRNVRTGGSMRSGAAAHYQTMTTRQVSALEVEAVAGRDAVLFLWVPAALLEDGLEVARAWGFRFKGILVWRKTGRRGLGMWFRNSAELVILAVRGRVPAFRSSAENVIEAPAGRHSAKPAAVYDLIEAATLDASARVEFFARAPRAGWVQTGFGADGRDVRDAVRALPAELADLEGDVFRLGAIVTTLGLDRSVCSDPKFCEYARDVTRRVSGSIKIRPAASVSVVEALLERVTAECLDPVVALLDARVEPPADHVASLTSEARERIRRQCPEIEGRGERPA